MSALPLASVAASPLVSVVMATHAHDDPRFLRSAVDSVRGQTYPNLELIIVADGPLTEHADAYLSRLPAGRVRLLRLARNGGPARARNAGIEAAAGEYIAIMDADDVCAPDRIARQLEFLLATGSDVVGSSYVEIDGRDAIVGRKRMPATCAAIRARCAFFNPINNPTAFARAEVLKRHRYPEHLRLGEDYRLWIRLLRAGYVVNNHEAPLLRFAMPTIYYTHVVGGTGFSAERRPAGVSAMSWLGRRDQGRSRRSSRSSATSSSSKGAACE